MKKVLSLILSVVLIISLLPTGVFSVVASAANTGTTGECSWTLDGTVLTITGNGTMGNYNNTSNVSPWGTAITEVVIESGVTSVGAYAFYRCTALKSISLPSSVKSIGYNAFYYCESLPGIVIPDGVTSIGSEAFYKCSKINEVVLPDSLVSVGKDAFSLCRLTSIKIPQNVSSIGAGAFSYCSVLTSIKVDENNSTYYSANNCIIKKSTNALVAGCNSSVIPDGVTSIEDDAFNGCSARVNITIPDSVTRIGERAFAGSDYTSITMPKSVKYIAYGAFYLCSNLADVYYYGNRVDKGTINIGGGNEDLTTAHWHYAPCENDAHVYDYDCTTTCKNCDYTRVADAAHMFDNDCDEVCNVCGTYRIAKHIFEQIGENTAKCKVCNTGKSFDFIINTDDTITLSYEASKEFDFEIENTSIAKIIKVSSSVISSGSYYKKVSSAKISPVFIGETKVNVIDSNGVILASSTLLVVEGEHQLQILEVLKEVSCTESGKELYVCKFCGYQEEKTIPKLGHTEVIDEAVSPTCIKTGLTEGSHCSVCNEVFISQNIIEATGEHIWNTGRTDTDGNIRYSCDTCDATHTQILTEIKVTTLPNKTTYLKGEHDIILDGIVITAYYDDNTSRILEFGHSISWGGPFEPPIVIVTVHHGNKTTQIELAVDGWSLGEQGWNYFREKEKISSCWFNDAGKWYYMDSNGYMVTNCWKKDSKGWCWLGSNGAMATNTWVKDSKGWCYVDASGYCATNTWKQDSVGWCYLDSEGSQVKNKWILDGGKWYYLDANGYMVSNQWKKDSKGWVYLGSNGAMLTNAWCTDSHGWCYVGADGYAVTNCWKKDSKGWIWLNANGSMTKSAWVKDGGKWYYLDANGYMIYSVSRYIGGKTYHFNSNGVCTNP